MSSVSASGERVCYAFGPFELNVAGGRLTRGSESIPLRPKCFDLLLLLVERHGALLSKEKLLEKIWPDVVVGESTLSRTITELREALGDDPQQPAYIETVPRRGYRFIAAVDVHPLPSSERRMRRAPFTLVTGAREFPLLVGEHLMGRGANVAVPVLTPRASRHHARLTVSEETLLLEDLGSRNGTQLNGVPVAGKTAVHSGDRIQIAGETFIVWSQTGENDPTEEAP